jgi:hypothetical protein
MPAPHPTRPLHARPAPQNDLQAMARCHRIGQTREVTVYRLITKDTYEEQLFSTASRKYGKPPPLKPPLLPAASAARALAWDQTGLRKGPAAAGFVYAGLRRMLGGMARRRAGAARAAPAAWPSRGKAARSSLPSLPSPPHPPIPATPLNPKPCSGLDEAVLGFSAGNDPEADSARIAQLLRHGAHSLAAMEEKATVGEQFAAENIDTVRRQRHAALSVLSPCCCNRYCMYLFYAGIWHQRTACVHIHTAGQLASAPSSAAVSGRRAALRGQPTWPCIARLPLVARRS